ncbi:Long-chain-alcohol oxidase FAO4B [Melia azedarach]|uniref:Long-chain-alcohol oxidase FAO4B n=1 Tax=Melia azedarach TaxID=155640 RepID=A0ACC1X291_MELAZ|nr:Long-chain-alcohol oxidase FAO4B [Melia azedarach]
MEKQAYLEQRLGDEGQDGFDAVVVGSGYGGSVASFRMSMAGIKVCLLEKGRQWEARDFPADSLKIMSAVRMENRNVGFSLGPKDALFQVYEQGDSLAVMACGLGGGSLVNAGVMLPTPVRAKRNPKWPKEWERDWDSCEASAAAMLRIQSVPVRFPVAKVMGEVAHGVIEEISEDLMKLSVNFDLEERPSNLLKPQQMGSCLACGNCLAGCSYNAKNSTDKNYILSAIQAGCVVKTECQVQYVVKNPYESLQEDKNSRKRRRWFVYLNEVDYITSDFVILSAGVLGTTEILFQSQMRGLKLSEVLGSGFSCNGNNVAYLAGSPAPLNSYGLKGKEIPEKPFQVRPGPAISSSYTSSLGFTIQSAVLPTAYPYMLFKGITTYGWPTGYWFCHGIIDKLMHFIGYKSCQAMVLNAMGYDESNGKIMFEKSTNKICFSPPQDPLLPRKIEAFQKLTKKLGGILFMSRYRSTSVHLLGGCNASSDPSHGVCNPNGQVFDPKAPTDVHPGLYVCDASLIPCSVGINPSLTIAAAAEHVSRHLVKDVLQYKNEKAIELIKPVDQYPHATTNKNLTTCPRSVVVIKETMKGYIGGMPCTAYLKMKMNSLNHKEFDEGNSVFGESHPLLRGKVGGYVVFSAIEKDKLHIIDGKVDLCQVDYRTPYAQYMHYRLLLADSSGLRYILEGKKILKPFLLALYAWRETTTLHVTFKKISGDSSQGEVIHLTGELLISLKELLKSLMSLEGNGKRNFLFLLSRTLLRTYILQIPRGNHKDHNLPDSYHKSYPNSILHEIKTEDGYVISCRQWKCNQNERRLKGEKQLNPVLLLNGYSTESYWLLTESNDLLRALLEEGHETWLLQSRLHHLTPANNFTIEDIGRFDIPAAIDKILEFHGRSIKVHVVAHCAGGLAVHIALMGGHVSATHIASLSCTNSSMFFKLNALPAFKMWLPLVPVSMAILGENKILPLSETSKTNLRHQLLKCIARLIPRYERCTCNECEVLSGIFGNAFWHQNLSPAMHNWLNRQDTTTLPMAGFPHLRKICNSGYIVDSNGNNSYLIHPERMTLSTLYISGGRSLLVTPETSFLAHKYMKLHQPGFRHERVVIDGFGHSDLLIGEESYKKVFPHILSHIRLAEDGKNVVMDAGKKYSKEAMAWEDDPYGRYKGLGNWFSPGIIILVILLCFVMLISLFK